MQCLAYDSAMKVNNIHIIEATKQTEFKGLAETAQRLIKVAWLASYKQLHWQSRP